MKLHIASDLHLDLLEPYHPGYRVIDPVPDADILVLAGDIHSGAEAIRAFRDFGKPVIYVPGNHEYYRHQFWVARQELHRAAEGTNVLLLDDGEVVIDGVRFLGSTLWTDYKLVSGIPLKRAMLAADVNLGDKKKIMNGVEPFAARDALKEHKSSRRWLKERLAAPFDGKTVVVTHHGCSAMSIAERFEGNALNGAFMSNLDDLVAQADLWIHGHIHDTMDYVLNGTRVVANPRGYAWNRKDIPTPPLEALDWENKGFVPDLVVEV
jgi:predicted phosphodiesterase